MRTATPAELDILVAIDDDAGQLYAQAGLTVDFPPGHPFLVNERTVWLHCLERGDVTLAVDEAGAPVGFAALELLDGAPYLEQLSVRFTSMRQGIGRALLGHAVSWARPRGNELWLTTYGHLPWNLPFYEKEGFVVMPPAAWGPQLAARFALEHEHLPAAEHRVVMRRSWLARARP